MRIGIDVVPLGRQRTGIGNYIHNLVEFLPQIAPQHEYFLYSNRGTRIGSAPHAFHARTEETLRWWPGSVWLLSRCSSLVRKDRIDVYWATATVLPPFLPSSAIKIVTVYDMVWLRYPETTTHYNLLIQKLCTLKAIEQADLIVMISRTMQEELVETLGVPKEKTRVVYPGIPQNYKPHDGANTARYIAEKYDVPDRYMLTVGTIEPRKNLDLLVKMQQILKAQGLRCPLLVAGAKGWKTSDVFRTVRSSGLREGEIRFLGYVPDEDMPLLYSGSQAFLFPSLYEGFGLPPVEAMACGVPVIASNAPSMPEVLGDKAILASPQSAEAFAAAVTRVLSDDSMRRTMRTRGIEHAEKFRARVSAEHLLDVFEESICREIPV